MPVSSTTHVRPKDWHLLPETELRLSILDLIITRHYNTYALIFELDQDVNKQSIAKTVQQALENTLSQCRHIAGTIETNSYGDFSIISKSHSTVPFTVKWLDRPEDQYPSFSDLKNAHFCSGVLGDPRDLVVEGMSMSSEASLSKRPQVAGFQLTFVDGGMIFTTSIHHFAMDITGTSAFVHQLAGHCHSLIKGSQPPRWDDSLADRSRFIPAPVPISEQSEPPLKPQRHPDWKPCAWLLFHMPRSKVAELKSLARPTDGTWVSTYDAVVAFFWRVLLKNRARIYKHDPRAPALFGEAVDMRNRLYPPVAKRYQGNMQSGGLSFMQKKQLTIADVISQVSFSAVAAYIRRITNDVDQNMLESTIEIFDRIRDKSDVHFQGDSLEPMSLVATDWRDVDMCAADFGFGCPVVFRQLSDRVIENLLEIYPKREVENDPDYGWEVVVPFERHAVEMLLGDPEIRQFCVFLGFEAGLP